MTALDKAILGLEQAMERPRRHHMWNWLVRHRLSGVQDVLRQEQPFGADAWLAPRESTLLRERETLIGRMNDLSARIAESIDMEPLRIELKRLVADLDRHRRRLNDLVYDTVSLELGGSE